MVRLCDNHTITSPVAQVEPDIAPGALLALLVALEDTKGVPRYTLAECVERTFRPWEGDAEFHHHVRTRADGSRDVTHACETVTYRESQALAAPERAFLQLTRGGGFEAQAPFIPDDAEWLDLDGLWERGGEPRRTLAQAAGGSDVGGGLL